jgi:hypothetical protein
MFLGLASDTPTQLHWFTRALRCYGGLMRALQAPLSLREVTTLVQIGLGASLDAKLGASAARLMKLGLVAQQSDGLHVTSLGAQRLAVERRDIGAPDTTH